MTSCFVYLGEFVFRRFPFCVHPLLPGLVLHNLPGKISNTGGQIGLGYHKAYLIIVADAVSVNFSGWCKFLQI